MPILKFHFIEICKLNRSIGPFSLTSKGGLAYPWPFLMSQAFHFYQL